jgi:hypothetical protein
MESPSPSDLSPFIGLLFGVEPYPYQKRIVDALFDPGKRKVTIRATTRAGKSYCLAMAAIMYASMKDGVRVGIIAPTYPKTKIIMNYIADLLASNPTFDQIVMVETQGLTRLERLRKEVSKQRITFKNGSSIEIKSVDMTSRGFGVTGWAYDCVIVEESAEIDDESYAKIYRMLVESEHAKLVEIGNPWTLGHFYQHHNAEDWEKIHIRWQDCVDAGRMTKEAVDDQRNNLTDLEFQVLFDAEFPDEVEMAVFTKEAIAKCAEKSQENEYDKYLIGVDVARGGRDRSVITLGGVSGRRVDFIRNRVMDTRDIMAVAGAVTQMADEFPADKVRIAVDCVGMGAGVHDRLKELKYNTYQFISGNKANDARHYNLKTEAAFRMNEMMKAGNLRNVPQASSYTLQLRAWTYEVRSDRKLKIVDPEGKSPDYADSLLIMAYLEIYYGMTEVRTATRGMQ